VSSIELTFFRAAELFSPASLEDAIREREEEERGGMLEERR